MLICTTTDTHYGFNGKSDNHHRKNIALIKREMDKVGCKVLLHAGDWATCRQRQVKRTWGMFREILGPDITIIGVSGNHDLWSDEENYTLMQIFELHKEWAKEFDIHLLSHFGPKIIEDVAFVGFDGWYAVEELHTNDPNFLPHQIDIREDGEYTGPSVHKFLQNRAYQQFQSMLEFDRTSYRKVVGTTHMPLFDGDHYGNPRWLEFMAGLCDIICFGHSHHRLEGDRTGDKPTLIYNAGSDYGKIRYLIFEV